MTMTKEKNNTHKRRTLPNDERLFRGSNVHETDEKNGIRCPYAGLSAGLVWPGLKALSHECRIGQRMRSECHFLASVDIRWKCVSCPFDPLTGRSSSGNLRCLRVLFFSFVNVIRFSCVKRHSFLTCWPMRHSCDRAFTNSCHVARDLYW